MRPIPMFALVSALAANVVACGSRTPQPQAPQQEATRPTSAQAHDEQAFEMHGPFFGRALSRIKLSEAQRASVGGLRDNLMAKGQPVRESRRALMVELASEVQAGRFDDASLAKKVDDMARAAESQGPAFDDAANKLHALLTPEQRRDLVATMARHAEHHGPHGGPDVNGPAGSHGGPDRGPGARGGRPLGPMHDRMDHLDHLARDLGLTTEQMGRLRTEMQALRAKGPAMGPGSPNWEQRGAFAQAFDKDTFDAKALRGPKHDATAIRAMAEHHVAAIRLIAGLLTAEQRTKFVEVLRTRSAQPHPHHHD